MNGLLELFESAKVNYDQYVQSDTLRSVADYTIIIPGHKRNEYINTVVSSFAAAAEYFPVSVEIIIIEQERDPTFNNLPFPAQYFYIPLDTNKQFNKSLCHNVGALLAPRSKYYIFHDIDTAVPIFFFRFLEENIREKNAMAIQCFNQQRLLHCNEALTREVLSGSRTINSLSKFSEGIKEAVSGAKGGSICVERDLFFQVGGFDTFFTGYSVEDAMFFNKISLVSQMHFCNSPQLELFHLWHEPAFNRVTKECDWVYFKTFQELGYDHKKEFITKQADYLRQFINP